MRAFIKANLEGVRDKATRKVADHFNSTFAEMATALSKAIGSGSGADTSGVVTGASSDGGQALNFGRSLLGQEYLVVTLDPTLINERALTVDAPVTYADSGAKGAITLGFDSALMTTVAPSLTWGAANVAGTGAPFAANATLQYPNGLMEYTNSKAITLSSTATINTLTGAASVTGLRLAGDYITFHPTTTNKIAFGSTSLRWLSGAFGTNGINVSGASTLTGAVTLGGNLTTNAATVIAYTAGTLFSGNMIPSDDEVDTLGDATHRMGGVYTAALVIPDLSDPTYNVDIKFNSSTTFTADKILVFDLANVSRTIKLTGDPTLADWFDQSVKTSASPEFVKVWLNDTATAFRLGVQCTSTFTTMTADRTLTVNMYDTDRNLKISGDANISQDYTTSGTPQFARLGVGAAADGTVLLAVNDSTSAPSTNVVASVANRYGGDTNYCGDPATWLRIRIGGATYKIPCFS